MKPTSKLFQTIFFFLFILCANVNYAQELTMFSSTSGFGGYEYYQDEVKIDKSTVNELMNKNAETSAYWKIANKANTGAIISGTANLGALVWFILDIDDFNDSSEVFESASFWTLIGTGIVSTIFTVRSAKHRKKAILRYNSQLEMGYNFTPSNTGLGVAMNF